jgi:hypothetical protein
LAQAVYGVILALSIDVTPPGATAFMRLIAGRNASDSPWPHISFRIVHRFAE